MGSGEAARLADATAASKDVAALAAALASTVRDVVPTAGGALAERLHVTAHADEETILLAEMLSDDLGAWPHNACLVIDDYHELAAADASETFIEAFLSSSCIDALILTRRRPAWASSRRILYGEVFELGQPVLAMTDSEARELVVRRDEGAERVIQQAQGWPAVLALAEIADSTRVDVANTPQLYEFLADELFSQIDARSQRALTELALYGGDALSLALGTFGRSDADHVTRVGTDYGFLTTVGDRQLSMHPLLRSFLIQKLHEERPEDILALVTGAVEKMLEHALWDEAYGLIRRFEQPDLLPELVRTSMDALLEHGRTSTLRGWVRAARVDAPILRLALSELAFREGRHYESEVLAALVATEQQAPELTARAYFVAGRAAHVASREAQSRSFYEEARKSATSPEFARRSAFGELVAAIELEDKGAEKLLDELANDALTDPVDRVLLADRKLAYETRFGTPVDLNGARSALQLLTVVSDPVVRTSFRNVFGYALASTGHLDEATRLTNEQLEDVARCRLEFVRPYALIVHALVAGVRREYETGVALLDEADELAVAAGDMAVLQVSTAVRIRLAIAQGDFEHASLHSDIDTQGATKSLRGELKALHALALAGSGRIQKGSALASAASASP